MNRRAAVLALAAFSWALALVPAAFLVPVYSGTSSSSTGSGQTTTAVSSSLIGENGYGILWIVLLPSVLTAISGLALHWKRSRSSQLADWIARITMTLLGVVVLLGAFSVGLFVLPSLFLLLWATRLTPLQRQPLA